MTGYRPEMPATWYEQREEIPVVRADRRLTHLKGGERLTAPY
jgi:hypothetical protein